MTETCFCQVIGLVKYLSVGFDQKNVGTRSGEILRLENQLCFPLYAAANLLGKLYAPLLAEMDLTYPQYLVMLVLWEIAPLSVGEVGSKLYLDSGTLTPLLKRLELKGLLYRQRDKTDERRVLIHLTERGKVFKKKAASIPVALADRLNLDLDEAKRLRCSVKELVQLIQRQLRGEESGWFNRELASQIGVSHKTIGLNLLHS